MPQGRKKIPFSGKAKKQQLLAKRQNKSTHNDGASSSVNFVSRGDSESLVDFMPDVQKLNEQPLSRGGRSNPNRYVLQFRRETKEELQRRREEARKQLVPVPEERLEADLDHYFPPALDFPVRPNWDFSLSRDRLEASEHKYFSEYVAKLDKEFSWSELSYFELNLETWRQLWRVLEMADIVLVIVDIRFPALMFPPSLYNYVSSTQGKRMILVLNKVDLAPAPLVVAWSHYFKQKFPELIVLTFTSFPSYNLRGQMSTKAGLQVRRRKGKLRMAAEGAQKLLEICQDIVQNQVDLSSWQTKISEEMGFEFEDEDLEVGRTVEVKEVDTGFEVHDRFHGGVLTIGCIGQPNVGKSSLMNAIMGKKVVSVSRTPGHTKHFQTIFLTPTVRLCDCPGLVFPSKVPKTLQILMGSYPIAQVREPFSVVQFLAERLDLVSLLKLQHPESDDTWSAIDICDGWALKQRYYTARTARLDTYRAANSLLRMSLEGKIALCLKPPGYNSTKSMWAGHSEVESVKWVQALVGEEGSRRGATACRIVEESENEDEETDGRERECSDNATASSDEDNATFKNKFTALAGVDD